MNNKYLEKVIINALENNNNTNNTQPKKVNTYYDKYMKYKQKYITIKKN